jgi:hypothetical protein
VGSNPTLSANSLTFGSVVGGSGRLQASRGSLTLTTLGTNPTLSATPSLSLGHVGSGRLQAALLTDRRAMFNREQTTACHRC